MSRIESSGHFERPRNIGEEAERWLQKETRGKEADILPVAQKFSELSLDTPGLFPLAETLLLAQHFKVMPKRRVLNNLDRLLNVREIHAKFKETHLFHGPVEALRLSNHFAGYLETSPALREEYLPQLVEQGEALSRDALMAGDVLSTKCLDAWNLAGRLRYQGNLDSAATVFRESAHWAALDGVFGPEGKEQFDPMAITSVRRWLAPYVK